MSIRPRIQAALPLCAVIWLLLWANCCESQEWMYRRSYFSHRLVDERAPPHPEPESRSAYRPAYYREGFTVEFRSGYRVNNFVLQNGGRVDRTYYREGWFQMQP